jgi:Xaa-Pro dipeptidase
MALIDLNRARNEMNKRGIDALVATTPENFYYCTKLSSGLPKVPAIAVVFADSAIKPVMIVDQFSGLLASRVSEVKDIRFYPAWYEIVHVDDIKSQTLKQVPKRFHPDLETVYAMLADIFREKKLEAARIGLEISSLTVPDYEIIKKQNPRIKFVEAEEIFLEIRRVKTVEEIENLKTAAKIAQKGIQGMIKGEILGLTAWDLYVRYKKSVVREMTADMAPSFDFRSLLLAIGDPFRNTSPANYHAVKGDTVLIDCGVMVNHYVSDMGRTYVVGKPSALHTKLYTPLRAGFEEALAIVKPGVKIKDLHRLAHEVIRKNGLDWYTRGHLGHNIGVSPESEQPPYISATEETILEPDMVICLETPLYVRGFGGFQIEEMIHIIPGGHELLTSLSRDLITLEV